MEKKIDVIVKYNHELLHIKNKLNQLESERVYDLSNIKMDGYLSRYIKELREMIADLLYKIEYGVESISEEIKREYRKKNL